jgi:Na+/phosphate symporter
LDTSSFTFIVLPLGIIVFSLSALAYFLARKEEHSRKKTKKLLRRFIEERARNRASMHKEIAHLNQLYENKQIDKETCNRLKDVLIKMNDRKEEETDVFTYLTAKNKR